MDPRIREGDEYGGGLTGARASEAKGPFPGGKRVGSWGKKKSKSKRVKVKAHGLRSMGRLFLNDERQKKTPPTSKRWMGNDCLKVAKSLADEYAAGVSWIAAVEGE